MATQKVVRGRFYFYIILHEQNRFNVSFKLCLNLCSRKWLKPKRSLVVNLIPITICLRYLWTFSVVILVFCLVLYPRFYCFARISFYYLLKFKFWNFDILPITCLTNSLVICLKYWSQLIDVEINFYISYWQCHHKSDKFCTMISLATGITFNVFFVVFVGFFVYLFICLFFLDPRPRPEGSYEIGSLHPSFRLSVSFLGIGSLVFSET